MKKLTALLLLIGLLASACGGGDSEPTSEERPDDIEDIGDVPTTAPVLAATPTAIPVEIEPAQLSYTIEEGDLLGQVAQRFNVPLGAIVFVNEFDDPNLVQIGQIIVIPTEEQVTEWEAAEAAAVPTEDPAATEETPEATTEADG